MGKKIKCFLKKYVTYETYNILLFLNSSWDKPFIKLIHKKYILTPPKITDNN